MNLNELQHSLRQLRFGGMAAVLEMRLQQAQAEPMAPIDLLATLVSDELTRRSDRLLERRRKLAAFRDPNKTLDNFDFSFNPKMNRSMVFDLATGTFIDRAKMHCFSGRAARAKAIWRKPSARPRSSRATRCSIVRRISCWKKSPKRPSRVGASSTWNRSPAWRC